MNDKQRSGQTLVEWLNSEEFYNLMQEYRHTPPTFQSEVVRSFERVKAAIVKAAEAQT